MLVPGDSPSKTQLEILCRGFEEGLRAHGAVSHTTLYIPDKAGADTDIEWRSGDEQRAILETIPSWLRPRIEGANRDAVIRCGSHVQALRPGWLTVRWLRHGQALTGPEIDAAAAHFDRYAAKAGDGLLGGGELSPADRWLRFLHERAGHGARGLDAAAEEWPPGETPDEPHFFTINDVFLESALRCGSLADKALVRAAIATRKRSPAAGGAARTAPQEERGDMVMTNEGVAVRSDTVALAREVIARMPGAGNDALANEMGGERQEALRAVRFVLGKPKRQRSSNRHKS